MTEQEHKQRIDDVLVAKLSQRFDDFIERYDRDCGALSEWRRATDIELKTQSKILFEISPAYTRGKWIAALIMIGSIGALIKSFWSHVTWR